MATQSHVTEFNAGEFHAQLQQISDFLGEIATAHIELTKAVHDLRKDVHTMLENVVTVLIQLRQNGGHK